MSRKPHKPKLVAHINITLNTNSIKLLQVKKETHLHKSQIKFPPNTDVELTSFICNNGTQTVRIVAHVRFHLSLYYLLGNIMWTCNRTEDETNDLVINRKVQKQTGDCCRAVLMRQKNTFSFSMRCRLVFVAEDTFYSSKSRWLQVNAPNVITWGRLVQGETLSFFFFH